ncbi:MAG: hypothetical protein WBQ89_11535 [Candidatus Acidiferrum sp.]
MSKSRTTKEMSFRRWIIGLTLAGIFLVFQLVPHARAQEFPNLDKKTTEEVFPKKAYSPNVDENYPTRVFWAIPTFTAHPADQRP